MRKLRTWSRIVLAVAVTGFAVMAPPVWSQLSAQAPAAGATLFHGARLVVGDGRTIENGAFVVEGNRLTWVGAAADANPPAGATRVDLTGKTVIPALIDTHTHLSRERDALVNDLERRAYYGVGAAMSLGEDTG